MGLDPKSAIDDLVAVMNEAKLVYKNIFFLIISQFNREIEGRIKAHKSSLRVFLIFTNLIRWVSYVR